MNAIGGKLTQSDLEKVWHKVTELEMDAVLKNKDHTKEIERLKKSIDYVGYEDEDEE